MRRGVAGVVSALFLLGCVRSHEARAASWYALETAHVHRMTGVSPARASASALPPTGGT